MTDDSGTWTVRRLLEWTGQFFTRKQIDAPRLSAELLLGHTLGLTRIQLYTQYERPLHDAELHRFRQLVRRAAEHEPIAYLTGKAGFFGLEFDIGPGVLIPRPDTETLVENVIQAARQDAALTTPRVLDLCTGSGCIAAAIAANLKAATVIAIDVSPQAVAIARRNIERLKLSDRVTVEQGDLFEPLKQRVDALPFDVITANPPYVPTATIDTLDANVRDFEPRLALDGGPDGLAVHRRILAEAGNRLVPGGRLYLEIQFDQGLAAASLVAEHAGYEHIRVLKDYNGRDRVVAAARRKS